MIEERAIVTQAGDDGVWVKALGPESCPRCAEGRGCGGGVLGRLVGRRRPALRVDGRIDGLRSGDTVVVGVDEGALMRASAWVYLVPLAGMFSGGAFAHLVLQAHDILVAGFGAAGLVSGFVLTHRAGQRAQTLSGYRPVLLRRDAAAASSCARLSQV